LPVGLAEFTLASTSGQAFYDISLVDGYNIPLAIVSLYPESGNSSLQEIPPNLTNPVCIGTASLLAPQGSLDDLLLGTNGSFPLPLDQSQSHEEVQRWCPWQLQLNPPQKPGDGVYPYPDDDIQRPWFNPCYSACAKFNRPQDCCTGKYGQPNTCQPSDYSKAAKNVCPDAYSYGKSLPYLAFCGFF
jgi:beta-mannosidase